MIHIIYRDITPIIFLQVNLFLQMSKIQFQTYNTLPTKPHSVGDSPNMSPLQLPPRASQNTHETHLSPSRSSYKSKKSNISRPSLAPSSGTKSLSNPQPNSLPANLSAFLDYVKNESDYQISINAQSPFRYTHFYYDTVDSSVNDFRTLTFNREDYSIWKQKMTAKNDQLVQEAQNERESEIVKRKSTILPMHSEFDSSSIEMMPSFKKAQNISTKSAVFGPFKVSSSSKSRISSFIRPKKRS